MVINIDLAIKSGDRCKLCNTWALSTLPTGVTHRRDYTMRTGGHRAPPTSGWSHGNFVEIVCIIKLEFLRYHAIARSLFGIAELLVWYKWYCCKNTPACKFDSAGVCITRGYLLFHAYLCPTTGWAYFSCLVTLYYNGRGNYWASTATLVVYMWAMSVYCACFWRWLT